MADIFQLPTKDKNEGMADDYMMPSGFPSPAMDAMTLRISLHAWLVKNPLATFYFLYEGEALNGARIPSCSWFLVNRSLTPENKNLVVCSVDRGDLMAGFYSKEGEKCWLSFANKKYKTIAVHTCSEFLLWGVVDYIISDAKKLNSWLD